MSRLTERDGANIRRTYKHGDMMCSNYCTTCGKGVGDCHYIISMLDRLAAYEDTGLTPERVAELAEAEREGRIDIHPCREGDAVYFIALTRGHYAEELRYAVRVREYQKSDMRYIGKIVFLTRAEAEAALAGKEANNA